MRKSVVRKHIYRKAKTFILVNGGDKDEIRKKRVNIFSIWRALVGN